MINKVLKKIHKIIKVSKKIYKNEIDKIVKIFNEDNEIKKLINDISINQNNSKNNIVFN